MESAINSPDAVKFIVNKMTKTTQRIVIFHWLWFLVSSGATSENKLQEVWIWTPNDGINDYSTGEGYKHYTCITNYPFISLNAKSLNVSSRTYGGGCNNRMVLFSAAADLMLPEFYEIFIGETTHFRKANDSKNYWDNHGELPFVCDEFLDFTISWTDDRKFSVYNAYSGETAQWKDPLPPVFDIRGVGIKTGFGDEGLWKFRHSGSFDGYYCIRNQAYGIMELLERKTAYEIGCASLCTGTNDCLGINHNSNTNTCELLKAGQAVNVTYNVDWVLSTKCLDGHNLCQACM